MNTIRGPEGARQVCAEVAGLIEGSTDDLPVVGHERGYGGRVVKNDPIGLLSLQVRQDRFWEPLSLAEDASC